MSKVIWDDDVQTLPVPQGAQDALMHALWIHRDEWDAVLRPYGLGAGDVRMPKFRYFVRGED